MISFFKRCSHLILGSSILIYLVLRVFITPISDDEYLTYREHVKCDVFTIITSGKPQVLWASNNHVLNTLLIKLSLWIFGEHDWAFRIHILLAFVVCYYFVYKLLSTYIESPARVFAYLGILFLNTYLLDFFSIARGYAISMAGYSAALYFFAKYYSGETSTRNLIWTLVSLFIAVGSNFSALYFLPLFGSLFLLQQFLGRREGYKILQLLLFQAGLLAIIAIVAVPLSKALASGVLIWGSGNFFQDSFVASVDYYMHYNPAMGRFDSVTENWSKVEVYAAALITLWVFMQAMSWWLKPEIELREIQFMLLFQAVGLCVTVVLLHIFFDTPYPFHRAALLYSFPFLLALFFSFETVVQRIKAVNFILCTMLLFCIWHITRSGNVENTMEWYQNGDAKRVFSYLEKEIVKDKPAKKIVLGAEQWQYFSMAYYAETTYKNDIKLQFTNFKDLQKFDYLFVPQDMVKDFDNEYQAVKAFRHGVLLRYRCN